MTPSSSDKVFHFIVKYKREHDGNSPSIREICAGTHVRSTSHVHLILHTLEREGTLRINGFKSETRCIEIVGAEWIYPARSTSGMAA